MIPADAINGGAGGGGVAQDARIGGVHRRVEELHRVAAAGGEQRRRRPREAHPRRNPLNSTEFRSNRAPIPRSSDGSAAPDAEI